MGGSKSKPIVNGIKKNMKDKPIIKSFKDNPFNEIPKTSNNDSKHTVENVNTKQNMETNNNSSKIKADINNYDEVDDLKEFINKSKSSNKSSLSNLSLSELEVKSNEKVDQAVLDKISHWSNIKITNSPIKEMSFDYTKTAAFVRQNELDHLEILKAQGQNIDELPGRLNSAQVKEFYIYYSNNRDKDDVLSVLSKKYQIDEHLVVILTKWVRYPLIFTKYKASDEIN